MSKNKDKHIFVDEKIHRSIKLQATEKDMTMKEYLRQIFVEKNLELLIKNDES